MSHVSDSRLTISVAMTTFNGCPYLDAQLESIASQTRPPDEVVIGDDQSTDATADVIAGFAVRHPHVLVRFAQNPNRLGSTRNFEEVVKRCTGDVVVFSDQDDLWKPTRLERIADALVANPESPYVFSDGELIGEDGRDLGCTIFSSIDFDASEQHLFRSGDALRVLLRHNVVVGASLAVRRADLLHVLPLEPGWIHDYFIVFALEAFRRGVLLSESLIRYRRHSTQQVGVAGFGGYELLSYARTQNEAYCIREAENFQRLRSRLVGLGLPNEHPLLAALERKSRYYRVRAAMRASPGRAIGLMWRAWRDHDYHHFSIGWKQVVVDAVAAGQSVIFRG